MKEYCNPNFCIQAHCRFALNLPANPKAAISFPAPTHRKQTKMTENEKDRLLTKNILHAAISCIFEHHHTSFNIFVSRKIETIKVARSIFKPLRAQ